jgi:hypothetical protein
VPQREKPAAHFCGRVLNEAIHFEQNTMVNWTSQSTFDFVFHKRGCSPDEQSDIRAR